MLRMVRKPHEWLGQSFILQCQFYDQNRHYTYRSYVDPNDGSHICRSQHWVIYMQTQTMSRIYAGHNDGPSKCRIPNNLDLQLRLCDDIRITCSLPAPSI